MSPLNASRTLPSPIRLGTTPPRRISLAIAAAFDRLSHAWARLAQQRAERRAAAAQRAMLSSLDAQTLRDLGFGDWAASRPDESATLRREAELRGF